MSEHAIPLDSAMTRYRPNWFLRLLRFKEKERGAYRFKWGTIDVRFLGLFFEVIQFSDDHDYDRPWCLHLMLLWPEVWITLPFKIRGFASNPDDFGQDDIRHWGFNWYWRTPDRDISLLILQWKHRRKYFEMPWSLVHLRTETLAKDGTWLNHKDRPGGDLGLAEFEAKIAYETYPYRYLLLSGKVQLVNATICVEEREWRRRAWKRFRFGRLVRRTVEVRFDNEVGERAGSWKGGTIGCSAELQHDQTPQEALKHMERTRKF